MDSRLLEKCASLKMAGKTYSEKIKDLLEKYYEGLGSKFKHCRREKPLYLTHDNDLKKKPYAYIPEIYFEKKSGHLITFQVFDSQAKKGRAGDIFLAFFTKNVRFAYFIVDDNEELNEINSLISIIESKFSTEFNAKILPDCQAYGVKIPKSTVDDETKFFQLLDALKEKW